MLSTKWDYSISSVVGSSHVDRGQGKQDNSHLIEDDNGNISFCISDGAGSSKNSEVSSKIVTNFINQEFLKIPDLINSKGKGPWINDFIIQVVIDLRAKLFDTFKNYDLRDYHCTLVAGLVFEKTAIVVHVGDGFILAGKNEEVANKNIFNKSLYFSKPENGEYKNETYFITEPIWLKHLRIQVLPDIDWLIAGSDGGEDILSFGEKLQDNEVLKFLDDAAKQKSLKEKNDYIFQVLNSDVANSRTKDDKSLCLLFSENIDKQKKLNWAPEEKLIKDFYPVPKPIKNPIPRTSIVRPQVNTYQKPLAPTQEYNDPNEFISEYGVFSILLMIIKRMYFGSLEKVSFYIEWVIHQIIKFKIYSATIALLIFLFLFLFLLIKFLFSNDQINLNDSVNFNDPVNLSDPVKEIDVKDKNMILTPEVITNNDVIEESVNNGASVNELITDAIENDITNDTKNEDTSLDKDVTNGEKVTTGNDNET